MDTGAALMLLLLLAGAGTAAAATFSHHGHTVTAIDRPVVRHQDAVSVAHDVAYVPHSVVRITEVQR